MRITAIVGSLRRGNTYAMVEAGCHALKDCETELIHLKDLNIKMCDGCLTCDSTGKCHIKDDMNKMLEKLKNSDGFIIGSPTRWDLLSGELKVFLDRLNPLAVPELLKGKYAILFVVGQTKGDTSISIKNAANSLANFCDSAGINVVKVVKVEDCLKPNDLITKYPRKLKECKSAAEKLYKTLNDNLL
jgi:multimeric flavodoxin WrbA